MTVNVKGLSELHLAVLEAAKNPQKCELAYLVGPQGGSQRALFDKAGQLYCPIAVFGQEGLEEVGYEGGNAWKAELMKRGLPAERIISLPGTLWEMGGRMSFNTLTEQFDLARFALENGYRDVGFIAPYWQVWRCFMSAVAACKDVYPDLRIHPIMATELPWDEKVRGSQGGLECQRVDLMAFETLRIVAYQEKGDLPTTEVALEYLNRLRR